MRLTRMRWWHIQEAVSIEERLFGAESWSAAMFWNELASQHYYIVALDGEERVLGYAGLALSPPDDAWVQNIAVRADCQRGGIGRALLVDLLDQARRSGARQTFLEVAVDNVPAQRLYVCHGFEPVTIRRGYYQPSNTDALVMMREENTG